MKKRLCQLSALGIDLAMGLSMLLPDLSKKAATKSLGSFDILPRVAVAMGQGTGGRDRVGQDLALTGSWGR